MRPRLGFLALMLHLFLWLSKQEWFGTLGVSHKSDSIASSLCFCAVTTTLTTNRGVRHAQMAVGNLFDFVVTMRLIVLNDGRETFVHHGVSVSVLELSFASPKTSSCVLWCLEPDLWGSDHLPICLLPNQSRPRIRTHPVINWDVFRQPQHELYGRRQLEAISHSIHDAISLATVTNTVIEIASSGRKIPPPACRTQQSSASRSAN